MVLRADALMTHRREAKGELRSAGRPWLGVRKTNQCAALSATQLQADVDAVSFGGFGERPVRRSSAPNCLRMR